jgi:hypothetical protein
MTKGRLAICACALAALLAPSILARSAGAGALPGTAVVHGPASVVRSDISSNWSGYVAIGPGSTPTTASSTMTYTDVTGQWIQPAAVCKPGSPTSVAFWVGLGGYSESSQQLEQAGTSADCSSSGEPSYYIWYELVPADSVNVHSFLIRPGDTIAAVVQSKGPSRVLIQVINRTRRTRFTKVLSMDTPDLTSAEWIAEAPSQCGDTGFCSQIPLTNFGSVEFTRSYAWGNGIAGTISSPNWMTTALRLVPKSRRGRYSAINSQPVAGDPGGAGAWPSPLSSDGKSFTIDWRANP